MSYLKMKLVHCEGYTTAVLGAMLSYGKTNYNMFCGEIPQKVIDRIDPLAEQLVLAGPGHDKFLEQIQYWLVIKAPLYWWKQFDTYRIGISKSSESTMHHSWKYGVTNNMFAGPVYTETLERLNRDICKYYSKDISVEEKDKLFNQIVNNLPDGYLQTRLVNVNAKTLRNMYLQRYNHKLQEWHIFCHELEGLVHGDLIVKRGSDGNK